MKTFGVLVVSVAFCTLAGCMFCKIKEENVIGKYRTDLPGGGVETLELLSNRKCDQEIRLPNGKTYTAHGTWDFFPNEKYLHFRGIRHSVNSEGELNPNLGDEPGNEIIATPISCKFSGGLAIMLSEDINYRKEK